MPLLLPGTDTLFESGLDNLIQHMRANGVIAGCQVVAHGVPDMGVRVGVGTIQGRGALVAVAQTDLVVAANGSGNPRLDLVHVDMTTGVPAIITGTPAADPKPPGLPANSIGLGIVGVGDAAVNVQNSNIGDRRLLSPIGQGIIAGTLANRPAATVQAGMVYFSTDVDGGTAHRSTGAAWVALGPGATGAPGAFTVTGDLTLVARLLLTTAAAKIVGGATSLQLRNNADSTYNLLLNDVGTAFLRTSLALRQSSIGRLDWKEVAVANDGVADLGNVLSWIGPVWVCDRASATTGQFHINGGLGTTAEIADPNAQYSITKDTASSTNVYWETDRYKIQNKRGTLRTYGIWMPSLDV